MNNKCKFLVVFSLIFILATLQVQAERYKGTIVKNTPKSNAGCLKPSNDIELSLNLVRAYIKSNGTMWNRENAEYEVPKGSGKTSMFSASLWIGGVDVAGQLYVAAMRFGQVGNDYWTGPLQMKDGSIDQPTCTKYDRFFRISRLEVERHINAFENNDIEYMGNIPKSIKEWPAIGAPGESQYLAPFKTLDNNNDSEYNPENGDYPYYDLENDLCPWTPENKERAKRCPWINEAGDCDPFGTIVNREALPMPKERIWTRQNESFGWDNKMIFADHVLKGDETIFWFLNDRGNNHSESGCPRSIGLEIRVQAFAFATNDELNKMTFYSYEIINRGSTTLYDTYFSQWVDPDIGNAWDDYTGCDVSRGLGYCYNGFEIDQGEIYAYGPNPPAVGVDFFQGPYIDPDGSDNPKFNKEMGDIKGRPEQQEYCKKFVHHLITRWGDKGPDDLSEIHGSETIIVVRDSMNIPIVDTLPLRWNNQFAINGVNFGDGIVDNERFGMRRFVYHSNNSTPTGDPSTYPEYYNLLRGIWKDGLPMTYGRTGYNEAGGIKCDFMFPRGTDMCNWGTRGESPGPTFFDGGKDGNWSEEVPDGVGSSANSPGDRRFMQSAGPFTLRQGACNYITVGIPWARATQGGVAASVSLLMIADDKCQALFENCFKLLDGPDAPHLTIREYDKKLVLLLTNPPTSNNNKKKNEDYIERDTKIPEKRIDEIQILLKDTIVIKPNGDTIHVGKDTLMYTIGYDTILYDQFYRFEGYQIFQVIGPEVGSTDLDNPSLSRLVRQCDIVNFDKKGNPIGRIINWEFDENLQVSIPVEKVNGANVGIEHSFVITQDAFATGSKQLVNYKTYYFVAIAYAYNEYWPFSIEPGPDANANLGGQKLPYLRGRKTPEGNSVTPIAAVPHPPSVHGGAATLYSDYGTIPRITRIDGQGNGGIALDLTKESKEKIIRGGDNNDYRVRELTYEKNAGPLNIKVVDPLRVKPFDYTLVIRDSLITNNATDIFKGFYWVLSIDPTVSDSELQEAELTDNGKKDGKPIREFSSENYIDYYDEKIIIPLGISVVIYNTDFVNRQKLVLDNWEKIMKSYSYNDYKAKLVFNQCEKIDIENDISFSDNGSAWITGLKDDNLALPSNWIRAGSFNLGVWSTSNILTNGGGVYKHYYEWRLEDAFYPSSQICEDKGDFITDRAYKDYTGKFGTLCNGTWAPYVLTSPYDECPQAKYVTRVYQPASYDLVSPGPEFYRFQDLTDPRSQPGYNQTMTNLYSVDVVITPDQSLWSRCIVLESCADPTKSEGGALKNEPRKAKSVGKDGKPDNSKDGFGVNGDEGMGWFPGYAINLETGERLNIMFSENSDTTYKNFGNLVNGNDMVFNPTSTYALATKDVLINDIYGDPIFYWPEGMPINKETYDNLYFGLDYGTDILLDSGIERIWGGMHYVYVCSSTGNTSSAYYLGSNYLPSASTPKRNFNFNDEKFEIMQWGPYGGYLDPVTKKFPAYECGPYDESAWLVQKFKQYFDIPNTGPSVYTKRNVKMQLYNNVMYTHIPLQPDDSKLKQQWMRCDVTYKIRVSRPYLRYISRWYEDPTQRHYEVPAALDYNGFPVYQFSTRDLAPKFNDPRVYQSILDNINIVPNPYYAGSLYENNPIQTMVKIINLPTDLKNNAPVTINIFTVNGILVRTLTKGDSETSYVNWDLKNYANIPIAGGVYIIHVNCPGIGERMLKFFCTMRPTDLNTF
jgi:hypothetical protein